MKVYMRSYKIQTVLIVMGAIMCTASALVVTVRKEEQLWMLGLLCLAMGIASWLFIQVDKLRREAAMRRRREMLRKQKPQSASPAVRAPVKRGL